MKKGFIHIFLLLTFALLVFAGIGYLAYKNGQVRPNSSDSPLNSPTPIVQDVKTINWETFTSNQYGFSFKYPNDYEIVQNNETIVTLKFNSPYFDNPNPYLKIYPNYQTIFPSLKSCTLENKILPCIAREERMADLKLDGKNAKKFIIVSSNDLVGGNNEIVQITEPQIEIQMNMSGGELRTTFDRILSTFKFTNSKTTSCGGWNTSGEIICKCNGKLIKPTGPPGAIVDGQDYYCDGQCGNCCYRGSAENSTYPKCI